MADHAEPLLADASELATRTGLDATDPVLLDALRDASRRFAGAVGHAVVRVVDDYVELDGLGSGVLSLPAAPVIGLIHLEVDGVELERTRYSVSRTLGLVKLRHGCVFPHEYGAVSVTYTHGFTPEVGSASKPTSIPFDIQGAVLEAAEIQMNVEAGLTGRTVLGDTVQYGSATVGATQRWTETVNRYARA